MMADQQPTPEEEAAAQAQAAADARAREVAGAPPAKADKAAAGPARARVGAATRYAVLHGAVGAWPQGTIVTAKELRDIGADDDRIRTLVEIGAIAEHQGDQE